MRHRFNLFIIYFSHSFRDSCAWRTIGCKNIQLFYKSNCTTYMYVQVISGEIVVITVIINNILFIIVVSHNRIFDEVRP